MLIRRMIMLGLCVLSLALSSAPGRAARAAEANTGQDIKVDIPLEIKSAKVLFDIGRMSFAGDVPLPLMYMDLMTDKFKELGTKGRIIGIFYGDATYLVLNDAAYNARRRVTTGNPYKGLLAQLQGKGVELEICVNAMKFQNIKNEYLLPGVKVNGGANLRMVQLVQEGFVRLQP